MTVNSEFSTDITNTVCVMYDDEGMVYPPKRARNIVTVAVDNIDPTSATTRDSFPPKINFLWSNILEHH